MRSFTPLAIIVAVICELAISPNSHAEKMPLTLSQAVESALANNLNLQLREVDVQEAEGVTLSAQGKFDTLLSAETGVINQHLTPLLPGGTEETTTLNWNAALEKRFTPGTAIDLSWKNGYQDATPSLFIVDPVYNQSLILSIRQPLLKGYGSKVQTSTIQASEKQQEATSYLVDSEAADLVADVKKAYWELVYAWQDIEVQQLSLELAVKLQQDIEEKIQAGKLAEVEIFRPVSEVARREESLITGERAIGFAEDNLKFLINSQEWEKSISPQDRPGKRLIQPNLSEILEHALSNRPDLKAAELITQSAQIREKEAKNNILPDLSLLASIGTGGTDDNYVNSLENSFDDPETLWSVGVNFSVPLNNSEAKGRLSQARASVRKQKVNQELLRQQVRRTVRTTVRDVNLAIKALEATQKTTLATLKGLEAEEVKFEAGRATSLDVLVAQDTYSQALSQEKRAQVTYAQILAELDRIQGLVSLPGKI